MQLRNITLLLSTIFLLVPFFTSCDDDASELGLDILPGSDKIIVKYNDSIQLDKYQEKFNIEKLPTNDTVYLGYYKDPLLGEIKASLFTQAFLITSPKYQEPDTILFEKFDTAFLHLKFDTVYNGGGNVTFDVFVLNIPLKKDSFYNYNFDSRPGEGKYYNSVDPAASFEISYNALKKSTTLDIPLSREFAATFFTGDTLFHNKSLTHKTGFCIIPRTSTNSGLIAKLDLNYHYVGGRWESPKSYITFRYKYLYKDSIYKNNNKKDTLIGVKDTTINAYADFTFTSNHLNSYSTPVYILKNANHFEYDYSKLNSGLNGNDNDTLIYAMNFGGAKMVVDLSKLDTFPDKKRTAVSKAELELPYSNGNASQYSNKVLLKVFLANADLNDYDDYPYRSVGIACVQDPVKMVYRLDVTNYVQAYLKGNANLKGVTASKLVIGSNSQNSLQHIIFSKNRKATLKLKYTNF